MGVEKIAADERFERGEGLGGRVVLGDVTGGVAPDEREMRAGFERDWANEEVAQRRIGSAWFAERELHKGRVVDGGTKEIEEAVAGVGRRHGWNVRRKAQKSREEKRGEMRACRVIFSDW